MHKAQSAYIAAIDDLRIIAKQREEVMERAFCLLELFDPELAEMVCQSQRSRRDAAAWMSRSSRYWGGRSAYEVLAEGEKELLWERLLSSDTSVKR